MVDYPLRVFCISGKRKTGKDFVASLLQERLPKKSVILRISAPIKEHWARTHQLSYSDLLSDGTYKEEHRLKMIQWSEEQREKDPSCFCRETIHMFKAREYPIWIVSDARRVSDLKFFAENFNGRLTTVRIHASKQVRENRGFTFTPGIDDAQSECGLDGVTHWDYTIANEGDMDKLERDLEFLSDLCSGV